MNLNLIPATDADKPYLFALRKAVMTPHLQAAGITLSDEYHMARVAEAFECSRLIECDDVNVGLLKLRETAERFEILQLQIEAKYQGKGMGSEVLKRVYELAGSKAVFLTVLKQNPALNLYLRNGFVQVGEDEYEYHLLRQSNAKR